MKLEWIESFIGGIIIMMLGFTALAEAFPQYTVGYNPDNDKVMWIYDWGTGLYFPSDYIDVDKYRHDWVPADPVCRPITEPTRELSRFCMDYRLANDER